MRHTIIHTCGHKQGIDGPERLYKLVEQGKSTKERIDEIFRNKCAFLSNNICPNCYIPGDKVNDRADLKGWVYDNGQLIYRK